MQNKQIIEWFKDGVKLDEYGGGQIWAIEKCKKADLIHHIADVRGWAELCNLFDHDVNSAVDMQNAIGQFIVDAINEKIERSKWKTFSANPENTGQSQEHGA